MEDNCSFCSLVCSVLGALIVGRVNYTNKIFIWLITLTYKWGLDMSCILDVPSVLVGNILLSDSHVIVCCFEELSL